MAFIGITSNDTEIIVNNGGTIGGNTTLTFDDSIGQLSVTGSIKLPKAGTGEDTNIAPDTFLPTASMAQTILYPGSGTNVATTLALSPIGTGETSQNSQFILYNSDYTAGFSDLEALAIGAKKTYYGVDVIAVGTGIRRPINFSVSAAVANDFVIETDGTISVGKANYETLVTSDNDIPNKKYVDDNSGGLEPSYGTMTEGFVNDRSLPLLTSPLIWTTATAGVIKGGNYVTFVNGGTYGDTLKIGSEGAGVYKITSTWGVRSENARQVDGWIVIRKNGASISTYPWQKRIYFNDDDEMGEITIDGLMSLVANDEIGLAFGADTAGKLWDFWGTSLTIVRIDI
jgi:hypothetical protein